MKKVGLTLLVALVFVFSANAQLKNKQGETILPETGDWAIGIDAAPILGYFGNMFNANTSNKHELGFLPTGLIKFSVNILLPKMKLIA